MKKYTKCYVGKVTENKREADGHGLPGPNWNDQRTIQLDIQMNIDGAK